MEINSGSSSEIRRLENELKDTQVAFDLFQALGHGQVRSLFYHSQENTLRCQSKTSLYITTSHTNTK